MTEPPFRTRLGPPSLRIPAFALAAYVGFGALVEAVQFSLGLLWSQAFLLLGPVLLGLRASGFHPLRFMRADRRPGHPGLVLGIAASAFLCASALMGLLQSLLPERLVKAFDLSQTIQDQGDVALYVGIILGAPLAEEIVFRGCLLPILAETWPRRVAVLVQAAIFSLIHLDPVGFVPRFILGVAFGFLWLDTGSLWAGVFAHALNNGVSAVVLWLSPAAGGEIDGPDRLVAGALVLSSGVALAILLRLLHRKASEAPLPSRDPSALALPNPGGLWGTPELQGWMRGYVLAAAVGMIVVVLAKRVGF